MSKLIYHNSWVLENEFLNYSLKCLYVLTYVPGCYISRNILFFSSSLWCSVIVVIVSLELSISHASFFTCTSCKCTLPSLSALTNKWAVAIAADSPCTILPKICVHWYSYCDAVSCWQCRAAGCLVGIPFFILCPWTNLIVVEEQIDVPVVL